MLPNGDVLVAEQSAGYLTLLRDDGEGHAKWIDRHVEDLNRPYGLAWQGRRDAGRRPGRHLARAAYRRRVARRPPVPPQQRPTQVPPDQRKPVPGAYGAEILTKKGVFGIVQGHQNRHLAIDPKTGALFVGVGSSGNLGVEPEPKATIQRFDADGSNQTTFASGTRNPTALAFHPETGELWARGAGARRARRQLPSDYLIRVQQGGFYGWPYAYIGKHPQPGFAQLRAGQGRRRRSRPTCCSRRIRRCSTSCSTRATSFPPNTRAAFRRAEGLVEPLAADRLQGRARAVQGRTAGRLLRELRHRLLALRREPRRGLGPPRRTGRCKGRLVARGRRHRRALSPHR